MIEVFNFYDSRAVVQLNFHPFSTTSGNKYKLQKCNCHYNIRKYSFVSRVVNIWNSLPHNVVEADSLNVFNRLDKYWTNQDVVYDYKSDLKKEPEVYLFVLNVMLPYLRCGQRGIPAPVTSHWIGLDCAPWYSTCVFDHSHGRWTHSPCHSPCVASPVRKPTREAQGSADQSMKKPILVSLRPILLNEPLKALMLVASTARWSS